MHSIHKINTRFSQIGYQPNLGKIAFSDLSKNLKKDETILNVAEGSMNNFLGVVVATDLRVFYVGINMRSAVFIEEIFYEEIRSISIQNTQFVSVEILITSKKGTMRVKGCERERANEMTELINLLILENKS